MDQFPLTYLVTSNKDTKDEKGVALMTTNSYADLTQRLQHDGTAALGNYKLNGMVELTACRATGIQCDTCVAAGIHCGDIVVALPGRIPHWLAKPQSNPPMIERRRERCNSSTKCLTCLGTLV